MRTDNRLRIDQIGSEHRCLTHPQGGDGPGEEDVAKVGVVEPGDDLFHERVVVPFREAPHQQQLREAVSFIDRAPLDQGPGIVQDLADALEEDVPEFDPGAASDARGHGDEELDALLEGHRGEKAASTLRERSAPSGSWISASRRSTVEASRAERSGSVWVLPTDITQCSWMRRISM